MTFLLLYLFLAFASENLVTYVDNVPCYWQTGEMMSTRETYVGVAQTLEECHIMVAASESTAIGATRQVNSGACYAEFGTNEIIFQIQTSMTCEFGNSEILTPIETPTYDEWLSCS